MPNTAPNSLPVNVVIAVICRGNNILISKRAADVHLANYWEFPGGKIEQGEAELQALHRELQEELGITITQAEPLMSIPCHYPKFNVRLNVWIVSKFTGRASGKENQEIMWISKSQLDQVNFPDVNKHIINALSLPQKYVITEDIDLSILANKQQFIEQFKLKCKQHYQLIQLRFKSCSLSAKEFKELIQQCLHIANGSQVQLQVNSTHLNLLNGFDQKSPFLGVHLTSKELQYSSLDKINRLREEFPSLISASCHCLIDVLKANELSIDFIVLSPINKTRSHPEAKPLGWDAFTELTKQAQMPVYALGGMDLENIMQARQNGAQGIAGISCFL